MAKKTKAILLGLGLSVAAMLAGCSDCIDDEDDGQYGAKTEFVSKQKTETEILKEQREMYYDAVRDSIKESNGANALCAQINSCRPSYGDEHDVENLEYLYSLGGVMENEVFTAGRKIIENAYKNIVDELAKYGVRVNEYATQDTTYFKFKNDRNSWSYFGKFEMCFVGVGKDNQFDFAESNWDDFVLKIYEIIDNAVCRDGKPYGEGQKKNMKSTVDAIVKKAKNDLIVSRNAVEHKYADYYILPKDQEQYLGIGEWYEGDFDYGYRRFNDNSKYVVKYRYISVYDSKLKVEFFGDKDATYKLVSLGNGKWQAVKTYKNGKVEKTIVFTDHVNFAETYYQSDESAKVGESYFSFEAGRNMGVHIYWKEVIEVQQRKKDWKPVIPAKTKHVIDSLRKEINRKYSLQRVAWQKAHEADSIARIMVQQRYGRDQR